MKLYYIRPIRDWTPWYDTADGFIVRAESEEEARQLASSDAGCEGEKVWLDPKETVCEVLSDAGKSKIIIRSFHAA